MTAPPATPRRAASLAALEPILLESFRIDPETGGPVLEIAVDRYDDLFNTLDRAPFRRRDLSPDLKQYLQECSVWVPMPHPMAFDVQLAREGHDPAREQEVVAGIRCYFAYLMYVIRSDARRARFRIAVFVGLSLVLLTAPLLVAQIVDRERVVVALLINGFTVGGWVFLWEALSIAFIRRLDQQTQLARYQRLVDAPIRFSVREDPETRSPRGAPSAQD